ncbi:BamA/TamA family outer membrane protein [Pendulispora albinea]|uniref:Outer membrane protein assembly factor n=1 Tax=Pendulispora albinea TaxID=2741071 RepID=A0ABZ2LUI1_9BACT
MKLRAARWGALLALAVALGGGRARAAPALSSYEADEIAPSLKELGASLASIDEAPEGKIVEDVQVRTLDVIEPRDPAPMILNALHTTSHRYVIEREVLLRAGDRYQQVLVDETARNLREVRQLSLVVVVPLRGSAPGRVRLLVVTKDVWSLRPSLDFRAGPGGFERLLIEPLERNVAGTHHSVVGRFALEPETYMLGAGYFVRRFEGTRLYVVAEANALIHRDRGAVEGSYGQLAAYRPLFSSRSPWGFGFDSEWSDRMVRRYVDAKVAEYDAPETPGRDGIPDMYRARKVTETAHAVRSFGLAHKLDVMFGAELTVRQYRMPEKERYDPEAVASFERARLPRSDNRGAPFLQVQAYESALVRLYNVDTLGLAEDFRRGYEFRLRGYPVTRALGSSRDLFGLAAGAAYTWIAGNGIVRASVESLTEGSAQKIDDGALAVSGTIVTPSFFLGRVVFDAVTLQRWRNSLNLRSTLGGNTRLRGYPSDALIGENMFAMNLELRTRPVRISSLQIGAVLFYDAGDAYDGARPRPKHSLGGGLRVAIPALDRKVIRLDLGAPLPDSARVAGANPVSFFIALEQSFPVVKPSAPGNATNGLLGVPSAMTAPTGTWD